MLGKRSLFIAVFLAPFLVASVQSENLTVILRASDYEIIDLPEGKQTIRMEEFGGLLEPGKPMLPSRVFLIGLPPGATVRDVTVEGIGEIELPGSYDIAPSPPPVPTASDREIEAWLASVRQRWDANHEATYNSDKIYPETVGEYLGSGNFRRYRFARVSYLPFAYHPLSNRLIFRPSARVSIDYALPVSGSPGALEVERLLADRVAEPIASDFLINYREAESWYPPPPKPEDSRQTYDYVIITTSALSSAVSPLVTWKTSLGYGVNVVTTSWINTTYPGVDLQEKIRNFLIDKYPSSQWGIEWVLLAGNIDVIPMRKCYPNSADHNNDVPTDHYYADLTGNWDSDSDGYPGEYGQDSVDIAPEVWVGRIPWSIADTLTYICNKIASFEADSGTWKNNTLFMGAILEYNNEDHSGWPGSDGADLHCNMALEYQWPHDILVEAKGLSPSAWWSSPWLVDDSLTYANALSWWSGGQYGMVNLAGHANSTSISRKIWSSDDGDGVPENPGEFTWPTFFDKTACASLNDNYPSIIFSIGCDNGYPEVANLGRQLLYKGGSGVITSTRWAYHLQGWWYVPQGGSFTLNHMFSRYLLLNDAEVGRSLYWAKVFYYNNYLFPGYEWTDQQNMFDFCLYGDPSMRRFPVSRPEVVATSPAAHSTSVSRQTNIQATFNKDILAATVDTGAYGSFFVWGAQSGPKYRGTMQYNGGTRTATFTPDNLPFFAGEKVITTLTEGILSTDSASLDRHAFSFTIEANHATNANFDTTASFPAGGWAGPMASADFNNDGFADLMVLDANTSSDSVFLLLNDGYGSFLPSGHQTLGSHPTSLCFIDVDRDGHLDAMIACDTMVVVLGSDGLGSFPYRFNYSSGWGAGSFLKNIRVHELGGRSTILDFAMSFGGNDVAVCLYKDALNGYSRYDYYDLPGGSLADLWLGDVNRDGEVDMVGSMNPYVWPTDSLWIMLNEGSGTFSSPTVIYAGWGAQEIYGDDFNGDGWVDLAVTCIWDTSVSVLMNDGSGGFQSPVRYPIPTGPYFSDGPHKVEGSDLDGDGNIDLIAFNVWTGITMIDSLYLFMNNGNGTFASPTVHALQKYPMNVFCADFDSDQDIDIAVSLGNYPPNPIQILWNTGGVQPGCIAGTVTDTAGDSLQGVIVQAILSSVVEGEDTTDADGWYYIEPLDAGTYDAVASKSGYLPDTVTGIAVTQGCVLVNLELEPLSGTGFIRGDPTSVGTAGYGDGQIGMADAIYILQHLYVPGTPPPQCEDALDADDSGDIAMSDAIYLLKYLYVPGSPSPPTPCCGYPTHCGDDPTSDALSCGAHPCMGPASTQQNLRHKEVKQK